ncbi:MAG: cryptochrome/photolyase family protein [Bacteroidia bacterium]
MSLAVNFFWFRRDLRLDDNAGLFYALKSGLPVVPLFIFDTDILSKLHDKKDARLHFIHQAVYELKLALNKLGSDLLVKYGKPSEIWKELNDTFTINSIRFNHDYEPYAIKRDEWVQSFFQSKGVIVKSYKDQCIFEKSEVVKDDGKPYTVFTPYSKKWKAKLNEYYLKSYPSEDLHHHFFRTTDISDFPTLETLGFEATELTFPSKSVASKIISDYGKNRDFPAINGTSKLGIHFRFGTISIREKARKAMALSEVYLNELIWRDFYMQILWHFPYVVEGPFKTNYALIEWRNNEQEFEKWKRGETGYPIVDAGMRELANTGFMHNRVRMIVASFLTKHLLIDWRWGEAWFAEKLLDFELSSNNGGWQWAAGCGTDAAPYFRVFNPALQTDKFDKNALYIKKWVPELSKGQYIKPIVNHEFARNRCLEVYKKALNPS